MGLETTCKARFADAEPVTGKLHLDSIKVEFSSKGFRWESTLHELPKVRVNESWVVIGRGKKSIAFELGEACEKWKQKMENPPTRVQKLAIKPEQSCFVCGKFDGLFTAELADAQIELVSKVDKAQVVLAKCDKKTELTKIAKLVEVAHPKTHFWFVWPKGVTIVTQNDVMEFAKSFGMGPSKSCAFDDQLSAMRFMKK